nr:hypothetical protein [uncultured Desulfobulbus sp.]
MLSSGLRIFAWVAAVFCVYACRGKGVPVVLVRSTQKTGCSGKKRKDGRVDGMRFNFFITLFDEANRLNPKNEQLYKGGRFHE